MFSLHLMFQHADSVGALLADGSRHSLSTSASVSTLSSSLNEPEAERPGLEVGREEWLHLRTNSLDRLSMTDLEARRLQLPFQREEEEEEEEKERVVEEQQGGSSKEEEEEEEILVKDEQVADFASSVLAAISCWHYRARALLFTRVPTVRLTAFHHLLFSPISCTSLPSVKPPCLANFCLLHAAFDACF